MSTYTDDDVGLQWTSRCDELERRIKSLEQRIGDGAKGFFDIITRHLKKTRDAIEFLEGRALRPADRRPEDEEARRARYTRPEQVLTEETVLRLHGRSLAVIEARVDELEKKLDAMSAFRRAAETEAKKLMGRVDVLEERCLLPGERNSQPLELRNLFDHIDPMLTIPGANIGKT